jgi:methionyl-tRNA formyltransferase
MNILYLGPDDNPLIPYLSTFGDTVTQTTDPLTPTDIEGMDFLISYRYQHLIRQPILDYFGTRAINLHISLLPWNRGADPNLWSWVFDTPKGVSIHVIDAGLDTGPILAQQPVLFSRSETLASSYEKLNTEIITLFQQTWPTIRAGKITPTPQPTGVGSLQRIKDKARIQHHLHKLGWQTPVSQLIGVLDHPSTFTQPAS